MSSDEEVWEYLNYAPPAELVYDLRLCPGCRHFGNKSRERMDRIGLSHQLLYCLADRLPKLCKNVNNGDCSLFESAAEAEAA